MSEKQSLLEYCTKVQKYYHSTTRSCKKKCIDHTKCSVGRYSNVTLLYLQLLFQLDTLHDELLEAEAENAKLHTLVESLQASVGKHQDALQILVSSNSKISPVLNHAWDYMIRRWF